MNNPNSVRAEFPGQRAAPCAIDDHGAVAGPRFAFDGLELLSAARLTQLQPDDFRIADAEA